MSGLLIVLEGAEGVGKTTQVQRLSRALVAAGRAVTLVREPGGTPMGNEVRRLLLEAPMHIVPRAEALLFMASRAQLVDDVIVPALGRGEIVLTDRFFLSTYAYQAAGRGLDEGAVRLTNQFATNGVLPSLTLLLDLPVGEGVRRAAERGEPDRVERSGDAFHRRVALAFREFATPGWQARHAECGPVVLVDASGSEDEVGTRIMQCLAARFPETFGAP